MLDGSCVRVIDGREKCTRPQVLVSRKIRVLLYRRDANAMALRCVIEIEGVPLANELLHELMHHVLVFCPALPVGEDFELGPVRPAHEFNQPFPLVLFHAYKKDGSVAGLQYAPGDQ